MTKTRDRSTQPRAGERRRRVRLSPERRREDLLRAVERVVTEVGCRGATVPRVVERAGVAQGTFYRYFRDIDGAVAELLQRAVAPVRAAAAALDLGGVRTAADVEEALRRFYRVLARELVAHPVVLREAVLVAPAARGDLGAAMSEFLREMRTVARGLVEGCMGRPPFRATTEYGAVADAVVGMILGAAQAAFEDQSGFDPERWAREMARFEAAALVDPRFAQEGFSCD